MDNAKNVETLKDGDIVYVDGAYLRWDEEKAGFVYDSCPCDVVMFRHDKIIEYLGEGQYEKPCSRKQ